LGDSVLGNPSLHHGLSHVACTQKTNFSIFDEVHGVLPRPLSRKSTSPSLKQLLPSRSAARKSEEVRMDKVSSSCGSWSWTSSNWALAFRNCLRAPSSSFVKGGKAIKPQIFTLGYWLASAIVNLVSSAVKPSLLASS